MPQTKQQPSTDKDQFCFEIGQFGVDTAQEGKKKRTFSGIAYSGEPITDHWYWDRIIFYFYSMQIKGRIPALLEHRSSQRAGAVNSYSISHEKGLEISGDLLSNEFGTQVAQDSDDCFPWQFSELLQQSFQYSLKPFLLAVQALQLYKLAKHQDMVIFLLKYFYIQGLLKHHQKLLAY